MARKEATITIDKEGRDRGKVFLIREAPATQVEWWATRALLALMKSGVEVPDDIASAGLAGVVAMGLRAFGGLAPEIAKPLLDEMWTTISFQPTPGSPVTLSGPSMMGQIEEISTLLRLREEVVNLHSGFSLTGFRSRLMTPASTIDSLQNIATSPAP